MSDIANKDEALKCADIARQALAAGDTGRADKFAQKALRLFRCPQTEGLSQEVADALSGGARGGGAEPSRDASPDHQQQHQQHSRSHGRAGHHGGSHHRHSTGREQQQQQQQQNGAGAGAGGGGGGSGGRGPGAGGAPFGEGVEGLRRRGAAGEQQQQQQAAPALDPSVTPEQRQLVNHILKAKDYYDTLGLPKDADDDDIKRAYRKLALKLHPDKNKAPKAEDAFKAVSRAFSCLSDADKRAHYDRTGYESRGDAATAAAATRGRRGGGGMGPFGGGGMYYGGEDIDPEEIFNMFFGASAFGPHRAFRTHFGNAGQHAQRRQAPAGSREEQQRGAMLGLLQLLPVLLLVFMTLFSGSGEPAYSLQRDAKYTQPLATGRLQVEFFVKSVRDFDQKYGVQGMHARTVLERQVESEHYERAHLRCQQERMTQHRMYTWGNRDKAKAMPMPGCDELGSLNERLGIGRAGGAQQQRAAVY